VQLTPGSCHRRLRELERGVITGYRAVVDPAAVGLGFEALVQITLERDDAGTVASFEAAMVELPQVRHAERLSGDPDCLLRIVARDLDSYATLRDQKLATLPGVHRLTSTIVYATKGAIAFSGIPLWGGVKVSGCRDIADACLAWLATQAWKSAAGTEGCAGYQARPEYR
jgi:DNA-binding Lrp family transcriptional regulator